MLGFGQVRRGPGGFVKDAIRPVGFNPSIVGVPRVGEPVRCRALLSEPIDPTLPIFSHVDSHNSVPPKILSSLPLNCGTIPPTTNITPPREYWRDRDYCQAT